MNINDTLNVAVFAIVQKNAITKYPCGTVTLTDKLYRVYSTKSEAEIDLNKLQADNPAAVYDIQNKTIESFTEQLLEEFSESKIVSRN